MIRVGLVGAGKMGMSHLALFGAHPDVHVAGVCEPQPLIASVISSQTGIETYRSFERLIERADLDAVVVATPTTTHVDVAGHALERGLHVFVEKPLTLSPVDSWRLVQLAESADRANQVGYHNRFLGTFAEVRRLVRAGAIGTVHHIDGRAFGPVVVRPRAGSTWRTKRSEGGGCLHDYASHVIDLMNYVVGAPSDVIGARLGRVYSDSVEDTVHALFTYASGATGALQTDWSDESYRKMSTSVVVHGTEGRIVADRQECQVYLKPGHRFENYDEGWTVRYITDLQPPVDYYLRGEEYSAQIDAFVRSVHRFEPGAENSFRSAYATDWVVDRIMAVAGGC
jgi:scyllo-inositol 2-dehydrogenase (NADP+)